MRLKQWTKFAGAQSKLINNAIRDRYESGCLLNQTTLAKHIKRLPVLACHQIMLIVPKARRERTPHACELLFDDGVLRLERCDDRRHLRISIRIVPGLA